MSPLHDRELITIFVNFMYPIEKKLSKEKGIIPIKERKISQVVKGNDSD